MRTQARYLPLTPENPTDQIGPVSAKNKPDPAHTTSPALISTFQQLFDDLLNALKSLSPAEQERVSVVAEETLGTEKQERVDNDEDNLQPAIDRYTLDPEAETLQSQLTRVANQQDAQKSDAETKLLIEEISGAIKSSNKAILEAILPDQKNKAKLRNLKQANESLIDILKEQIIKLSGEKNSDKFHLREIFNKSTQYIGYQNQLIQEKEEQINRYQSPSGEEKLIEQRLFFNCVAMRTLEMLDPVVKSLNPSDAHIEGGRQVLRNHHFDRLQTRSRLIHGMTSETELRSPEDEKSYGMKLLSEYLEQLDLRSQIDLESIWNEARAEVLDQGRDWAIIRSKFKIHTSSTTPSNNAAKTKISEVLVSQTIETETTPIGHILNQGSGKTKPSIDSTNSPINSYDCEQYKIASLTDRSKTIIAGRNSHATTEHLHAVNAAKTECKINGETAFKGTRHATISPYHLNQNALKKMSEQKQTEVVHELTQDRPDVIRIKTQAEPISKSGNHSTNAQNTDEVSSPTKTELENLIQSYTTNESGERKTIEEIKTMAKTDPAFFALMRRRAALNRAREIFVSSLMGDPELLKRAREGKLIVYNSISLLTPSPIAQLQHKFLGLFGKDTRSAASQDELTMTEDQLQAWKDLQEEIDADRLTVDGTVVRASINAFTFGANEVSTGIVTEKITSFLGYLELTPSGPISMLAGAIRKRLSENDSALSGWDIANKQNEQSLKRLLGDLERDPERAKDESFSGGQLYEVIEELEKALNQSKDTEEGEKLMQRIDTIKALAAQLQEMWQAKAYGDKTIPPYEFTSRLALLSSMMMAGTAFNCKSGKDRTAQLDVETKFLAFQIETSGGKVPEWRREYTLEERRQFANFIFYDEARRTMQEYNTGVGGSKMSFGFDLLFRKFMVDTENSDMARRIKNEFIGLSKLTKS